MKYHTWEGILKRAEKVTKIDAEDNEKYIVKYKDKHGKPIDHIPREKSPLTVNRGFCINCSKEIKESTADDRYCRKCFQAFFGVKNE